MDGRKKISGFPALVLAVLVPLVFLVNLAVFFVLTVIIMVAAGLGSLLFLGKNSVRRVQGKDERMFESGDHLKWSRDEAVNAAGRLIAELEELGRHCDDDWVRCCRGLAEDILTAVENDRISVAEMRHICKRIRDEAGNIKGISEIGQLHDWMVERSGMMGG